MDIGRERNYSIKQIMIEDKDLKKFVRSFWVIRKTGKDEKIPKLFPLFSAHILIHLGGECTFETQDEKIIGRGNQIFHASSCLWDVHYAMETHIVGIELSPQGYYYLRDRKSSGKMNTVEEMKAADSSLEGFIEEAREEIRDGNLVILEEYLKERFERYYADEDAGIIFGVSEDIEGGMKVSEITEKYSISVRTLERKFKRNTGMTLKKYELILRLNKLLEDIYMNEDINWTNLAVEHGFFDQAHMIKVLKKYLGRTPNEYLKMRDLLGDLFLVD